MKTAMQEDSEDPDTGKPGKSITGQHNRQTGCLSRVDFPIKVPNSKPALFPNSQSSNPGKTHCPVRPCFPPRIAAKALVRPIFHRAA